MLTNNADYSCHINVLELFKPILIMQSISCQIMVLVINNLGEDTHAQTHAHTQTHTHTYFPDKTRLRKPGVPVFMCLVL